MKQVEKGHAEAGFAGDAAEGFTGVGMLDQHRQRTSVIGPGDVLVEGGEAAAQELLGFGVWLVADLNQMRLHRSITISCHAIPPWSDADGCT